MCLLLQHYTRNWKKESWYLYHQWRAAGEPCRVCWAWTEWSGRERGASVLSLKAVLLHLLRTSSTLNMNTVPTSQSSLSLSVIVGFHSRISLYCYHFGSSSCSAIWVLLVFVCLPLCGFWLYSIERKWGHFTGFFVCLMVRFIFRSVFSSGWMNSWLY